MSMNDSLLTSSPTVSAIITTYNRFELCKRAIKSAHNQTYDNIEILVIEDGSQSGIEKWLSNKFPEVRYHRHEKNKGLAAARNTGLELAQGEYIAYLDDDDVWKSERVTKQIKKLGSVQPNLDEDIGVIYCGVERRTHDGSVVGTSSPDNKGRLDKAIKQEGASTLPSTFLFDRDALNSVGGFDETLPSSIDHDIWMSLAVNGYSAVTLDEPLVIDHQSDSVKQMTTDTITRIHGVKKYVDKWTPTYVEWFGEDAGVRYRDQYFVDVISRLARQKAGNYSILECVIACACILHVSNEREIATNALFWSVLAPLAVTPLPDSAVHHLGTLKRYIRS